MKGKIALLLAVTMLMTFAAMFDVKADPSIHVYAYTDRIQYRPGESGTIKILVINTASDVGIIKNVTIIYPWYVPGLDGNDTINNISQTLTLNQNLTSSVSFTIPTDGRVTANYAGTTSAHIIVYYDYSVANTPRSTSTSTDVGMNIASAPILFSVQELGMLTTLLILLIIVVLVSALIVAYAVMRTTRKISA